MNVFWQYLHIYMHVTCNDNEQLLSILQSFVFAPNYFFPLAHRESAVSLTNCVSAFRTNFSTITWKYFHPVTLSTLGSFWVASGGEHAGHSTTVSVSKNTEATAERIHKPHFEYLLFYSSAYFYIEVTSRCPQGCELYTNPLPV